MNLEAASARLVEQGSKIPQMLNKSASLREQAIQAALLKNDLTMAARNAMENSSHSAQLNLTNPVLGFNEMVAARSTDYAGDALYRKIIDDARVATLFRPVTAQAGTLVHTKNGLFPSNRFRLATGYCRSRRQKMAPRQPISRSSIPLPSRTRSWCWSGAISQTAPSSNSASRETTLSG